MRFIRELKRNRRFKIRFTLFGFLALLLVDFGLLYSMANTRESLSTESADALYGGFSDSTSYPYAGYLLDYSSFFSQQVCGVTFLSSNIAISAAHCFTASGLYYSGIGDIKTAPKDNFPVTKYELHGNWSETTLRGDLAILSFDRPVEGLGSYAEIAVPRGGCNYEVLAYGSTDQRVLASSDLRRKATVCIEGITEENIYLKSPDGGICFGDSGSPIFVKNSNKIVGIISAISADNDSYSENNCFVSNTVVATRLDANAPFINSTGLPLTEGTECPLYSGNTCSVSQVCRSNQCRGMNDYAYISALDSRSSNYIFAGYLNNALLVLFGGLTFIFLYLVRRSFKNAY